jgi:hypothetical protein
MSKSMVWAAVVSLTFATAAFAQSNTAVTTQMGTFNNSAVSQSGARNTAITGQAGFAGQASFINNSYISQSGGYRGNTAQAVQEGTVNISNIYQR